MEEVRKVLCGLWDEDNSTLSPDSLFSVIWRLVPRFRYHISSKHSPTLIIRHPLINNTLTSSSLNKLTHFLASSLCHLTIENHNTAHPLELLRGYQQQLMLSEETAPDTWGTCWIDCTVKLSEALTIVANGEHSLALQNSTLQNIGNLLLISQMFGGTLQSTCKQGTVSICSTLAKFVKAVHRYRLNSSVVLVQIFAQ